MRNMECSCLPNYSRQSATCPGWVSFLRQRIRENAGAGIQRLAASSIQASVGGKASHNTLPHSVCEGHLSCIKQGGQKRLIMANPVHVRRVVGIATLILEPGAHDGQEISDAHIYANTGDTRAAMRPVEVHSNNRGECRIPFPPARKMSLGVTKTDREGRLQPGSHPPVLTPTQCVRNLCFLFRRRHATFSYSDYSICRHIPHHI